MSAESTYAKPREKKCFLKIDDIIYPLYEGLNTIGRTKKATVIIRNENVSQSHAIVTIYENNHFVSDIDSINGTFVNKKKLQPLLLYKVEHKDEICFADVTATYLKSISDSQCSLTKATLDTGKFINLTESFYVAKTQNLEECIRDYSNILDDNCDFSTVSTQAIENVIQNNNENEDSVSNKKVSSNSSIHFMQTQIILREKTKPKKATNDSVSGISDSISTSIHSMPTQLVYQNIIEDTQDQNSSPVYEIEKNDCNNPQLTVEENLSSDDVIDETLCNEPANKSFNSKPLGYSTDNVEDLQSIKEQSKLNVADSPRDSPEQIPPINICNRKKSIYIIDSDSDSDIESIETSPQSQAKLKKCQNSQHNIQFENNGENASLLKSVEVVTTKNCNDSTDSDTDIDETELLKPNSVPSTSGICFKNIDEDKQENFLNNVQSRFEDANPVKSVEAVVSKKFKDSSDSDTDIDETELLKPNSMLPASRLCFKNFEDKHDVNDSEVIPSSQLSYEDDNDTNDFHFKLKKKDTENFSEPDFHESFSLRMSSYLESSEDIRNAFKCNEIEPLNDTLQTSVVDITMSEIQSINENKKDNCCIDVGDNAQTANVFGNDINTLASKNNELDNEIFVQSTQKLTLEKDRSETKLANNSNLFLQATQEIVAKDVYSDKFFIQATQVLKPNSETNTLSKTTHVVDLLTSKGNEEIFLQPTQKMDIEINYRDSVECQETQLLEREFLPKTYNEIENIQHNCQEQQMQNKKLIDRCEFERVESENVVSIDILDVTTQRVKEYENENSIFIKSTQVINHKQDGSVAENVTTQQIKEYKNENSIFIKSTQVIDHKQGGSVAENNCDGVTQISKCSEEILPKTNELSVESQLEVMFSSQKILESNLRPLNPIVSILEGSYTPDFETICNDIEILNEKQDVLPKDFVDKSECIDTEMTNQVNKNKEAIKIAQTENVDAENIKPKKLVKHLNITKSSTKMFENDSNENHLNEIAFGGDQEMNNKKINDLKCGTIALNYNENNDSKPRVGVNTDVAPSGGTNRVTRSKRFQLSSENLQQSNSKYTKKKMQVKEYSTVVNALELKRSSRSSSIKNNKQQYIASEKETVTGNLKKSNKDNSSATDSTIILPFEKNGTKQSESETVDIKISRILEDEKAMRKRSITSNVDDNALIPNKQLTEDMKLMKNLESNKTKRKGVKRNHSEENDVTVIYSNQLVEDTETTKTVENNKGKRKNAKRDRNTKNDEVLSSTLQLTGDIELSKLDSNTFKKNDSKRSKRSVSDKNCEVIESIKITNVLKSNKVTRKSTKRNHSENDNIIIPKKQLRTSNTDESLDKNYSISSSSKNENMELSNTVCDTPSRLRRMPKPKVVFTMLDSPELESTIRSLGGKVVDSVKTCTVLVTCSLKRSQKLLTAVGYGIPICSPEWLYQSKKLGYFLDPWEYLLKDEEAETKWNFTLKESLNRSKNYKILQNYAVILVVSTATDVLKAAIESCGGKCVTKIPSKTENNALIVSNAENKNRFSKILKQNPNVMVVAAEAIFDGVLRQELHFEDHLLS